MLIDGKAIAEQLRERLRQEVEALAPRVGRPPRLVVVRVGDDPASEIYVRHKNTAAHAAGIVGDVVVLPASTTRELLRSTLRKFEDEKSVDGILLQLPLPSHLDESEAVSWISPEKDVDGFHPFNLGRLMRKEPTIVACTPAGVMHLIGTTGVEISGKRAVVVGRSNIVGKPVAQLLLAADATVTICHSHTAELAEEVARADILVAAVGKPRFIKGDWIKLGAVVIDVGMNRLPSGKLTGDVDFDAAVPRASHITPVPGGVGPMTIAHLLNNTLQIYCTRNGIARKPVF